MHFSRTIAASLFVVGQVLAQAAYTASATVAAAAGQETVHVVQVGGTNGSTIFSPNSVIAAAGDLVQFQFNKKNHSVVQSTFDQPCVPIQNVMPNKTDAFFSGFMANNHTFGASGVQLVYTIRVKDTKPIWFYCSQAKHCQSGMVGAINAATSGNKTVQAFAALAALAPANLSPGQNPADVAGAASSSGAVLGGASTIATATAAAPSGVAGATGGAATAASTTSPPQQSVNAAPGGFADAARSGLSGLAWAGIAAFFML
ncbi:Cupredoxin [Mytilinidion resinicola]|uniref:Cupredoxin n=1 Tax=Mytilinidion resinicola TaxID=574789 RepID=A0A6A6Z4J1_9PEZI|nr:Cupredoxin [Mytilinidion resinicola]KAF2816061.1 Cupredoxin [Mytilinidion resinicola]